MALASVTVAGCLFFLCYWLYTRPMQFSRPSRAYILINKVTHIRLLPVPSKHAFTYPTLAFLVSLDALERSALDLPISFPWGPRFGYLFRFGSIWGTLTGLRGDGYLAREDTKCTSPVSIRAKLDRVLLDSGTIAAPSEIRDVWMMTMPAICAFEGINPLTVYYCYRPSGEVSVVILEVHNTFGEAHVYILQTSKNEDPQPPKGYDHQWTFPRHFFVSPFNDRSGYYTVAIKSPSQPPFDLSPCDCPQPNVRINLRTPNYDSTKPTAGPSKLMAQLTPQSAIPLTTFNLLTTLLHFPFALFITLLRILYQAWLLHYRRYLPVFSRPEPIPGPSYASPKERDAQKSPLPGGNNPTALECGYSGGVVYQRATLFERYALRRTLAFLERRSAETGIGIELLSSDPSTPVWRYNAQRNANNLTEQSTLTMSYTSPRVFTLFLLAPSAHLFLRAGCKSKTDGQRPIFHVSDEDTFTRVFEPGQRYSEEQQGWTERITQRVRSMLVPQEVLHDRVQYCHPLAALPSSIGIRLFDLLVVSVLGIQDWVLKGVFCMFGVRFAAGTEPWVKDIWKRAV